MKALVEITDKMQDARACCGEDSDCNECPCQIGTDDCVYNHIATESVEKGSILIEEMAEELENCYGRETELTQRAREFINND